MKKMDILTILSSHKSTQVTALLLSVWAFKYVKVQEGSGNDKQRPTVDEMCKLYLAPSTIPGAGLGIFTTVARNRGDAVGKGEPSLPLLDYDYHIGALGIKHWPSNPNFAYDYIWWGPDIGMYYESATPYEENFILAPGLDAVINCHMALLNTDKTHTTMDALDLHRSSDPGVGAFTAYFNSTTMITHHIPAGGELFKFYGDNYFIDRPTVYPDFPIRDSYTQVEKLLREFDKRLQKFPKLPEAVVHDAWRLVTDFPIRSRTINAIPRNVTAARMVVKEGTRAAHQPFHVRDIYEIKRHGRCLESIENGRSTIRQAGRGAFAAAFFPEGSVVTGSPLLLIPTDDYFKMYDGDWHFKEDVPNRANISNLQIIINYCFHHPDSSIYLYPYGHGVTFINHNKTRANVKLRWAKHGEMSHNENLFTTDLRTLKYKISPGLFLDYVATKDISPGEELFLDYGDAWEEAWKVHEAKWNSHGKYSKEYQSAAELNKIHAGKPLRTTEEQEAEPYPENVMLHCFDKNILPETEDEDSYDLVYTYGATLECEITERIDDGAGGYLYNVEFLNPYDDEWTEQKRIPRSAIRFADAPYTSDMMLPDAFRHPIMLPDELMPDLWRGTYLTVP